MSHFFFVLGSCAGIFAFDSLAVRNCLFFSCFFYNNDIFEKKIIVDINKTYKDLLKKGSWNSKSVSKFSELKVSLTFDPKFIIYNIRVM